jgi:hypothetical protein
MESAQRNQNANSSKKDLGLPQDTSSLHTPSGFLKGVSGCRKAGVDTGDWDVSMEGPVALEMLLEKIGLEQTQCQVAFLQREQQKRKVSAKKCSSAYSRS